MRTTATSQASTGASSATATGPPAQPDQASSSASAPSEADLDVVPHESGPEEMALRNKLTVTVSEAAALLGISRALAYELVAREEIPAIRLGYRIVVPTHRLLDLVFNERTRPIAMTNGT
jgi:excisionase family DNA binding protein